jgi:hypothetical protein
MSNLNLAFEPTPMIQSKAIKSAMAVVVAAAASLPLTHILKQILFGSPQECRFR